MGKKSISDIVIDRQLKNKLPCLGMILMMGIVILISYCFQIPNPMIICIIVVVLAILSGGYVCGIICGAMTLLYSAYFFSDKHSIFLYSNENLYKIIVIIVALLIMLVSVGMFKQKYLRQTKVLEETNQLLYQKTILDELSGLYNYRYFLERLENMWLEGIVKSSEISLAMIDIDFFKKYNDYYGHQKGNECISTISDILRMNTQCRNGFVARYGGEEFVIVMPDTDAKEAKKIAEKIRSLVEEKEIEHKASELYRYITISIGIATIKPAESISFNTLITRADYVLYEAKSTGRNKVLIEDDIETRANVRKSDGRFIFPREQKEAYERLILPVGVFQLVEDKVITLLVSDGLCEMAGAGRVELIKHFNSNMFGNVHPDDVEALAEAGYKFARELGDYDVIYRTRFSENKYHKLHVVGKFQTVGENTRVAFLVYTDITN